ncbi:MAG: DUF3291 domain-containing protein [Trueperaceae bacterium]
MVYHIAQLNIGRMLYPLSDERMQGFTSQLEPINKLADGTPGFVWRLQDETGDATALRPFPDDMMIVNFSVWESIDALFQYTYYSDHAKVFRERKQWFEGMKEHFLVMWWIPEGHHPTLTEAKERLEVLRRDGPTPYAFNFKQRFDAPLE